MKTVSRLWLVGGVIVLSSCFQVPVSLVTVEEKQKGICYSCWWDPECYSRIDSDVSLAHLAETGADWINLTVHWYQDNIASTRISPLRSTSSDEDLAHVIGQARSLGLRIMLRPTLHLSRDASHNSSQIGRAFVSQAQWTEWFASYRAYIEKYAALAAAHGVDQFCVGSELMATTHRDADWRDVVSGVRARYAGPLVYACNRGDEARITWWDVLDFIGVEAYYPLTKKPKPTLAELKKAWRRIGASLASLSNRWRKPVLFTEVGYRSVDGAAAHPAWPFFEGTLDLQEQADCYRAVLETVYGEPWFAGLYWWSWSPDPKEGGPEDTGYSPHDKPAEEVLKKWYGGASARAPRWTMEPNPDRNLEIFSEGLGPGWEDRSWGATRDFQASDAAHGGNLSLRVRLAPEGAVSFWHRSFYSYMYYFLEFYVRGSGLEEPLLWAYFYGRKGNPLVKIQVNDPRYIEGGHISAGSWRRVFIPLEDMGVARAPLQRLAIEDRSGRGSAVFWIDDLRLIGATWRREPPEPGREPPLR